MDKEKLLQELQSKKEIIADSYDGSYELVREIVSSYATLDDFSEVTYLDMNAIYLMAIGTWKINAEKKKEKISLGCLADTEKQRLYSVIDNVWDKACSGCYEHKDEADIRKPFVGMFGTGFYTFENKTTDECAQRFVEMLVDISQENEFNEATIFSKAERVLNESFKGMKAASASVVLHCLMPNVFPIINGNRGNGNIFGALGIAIERPAELGTYIANCRKIKAFRDSNLPFKNYRILDMAAWNLFGKDIDEINDSNENEAESLNADFDHNLILYGPPGTGKTYNTVIYAVSIVEKRPTAEVLSEAAADYKAVKLRYDVYKEQGKIAFTTFHQAYGYEEFIQGIKPQMSDDNGNLKYSVEDGVFKAFCDKVVKLSYESEPEQGNFVFIIDEINRGNISKIFGELITLIESTKRIGAKEEMTVSLPYAPDQTFGVPKNVYILGTMNTADRSIALMDTALRRRFSFVEMLPRPEILDKVVVRDRGESVNVGEMLRKINKRIEHLYDREHTIGHAPFMKLIAEQNIDILAGIFARTIIPLLQEYFYEDYTKIRMVLGDNAKANEDDQFIVERTFGWDDDFLGDQPEEIDIPDKAYEIMYKNFTNIRCYKGIIKKI
ncbi:MAG: AAA family ATPase [Lachnospiraceae bacterium]|nr:AAA family ATPase [Candidatus Colinaster scatohippi]